MGIEELKRWHWIVIGVVVGLGLAFVWLGVEPPSTRNVSAQEFIRDVTASDDELGPRVRRVVIHPPQPNFEALAARDRANRYEAEARAAEEAAKSPPQDVADRNAFIQQKQEEAAAARERAERERSAEADRRVNRVTYKKWMFDPRAEKHVMVDRQFIAEIPFIPPGTRATSVDPNMTIATYLGELQKRHDHVSYTYGWWSSTPAAVAIWTVGSVAVIGLLWPILLNAMIGAGYGPKPKPQPEYDLSRFGGTTKATMPEPSKPTVTAAEQQRLRDLTDQLERNLASSGASATPAAAADGAAPAGGVRKLDGGPLEIAEAMKKPEDDDEIEVKGEYYPVLIHHKKQNGDTPAKPEKKD